MCYYIISMQVSSQTMCYSQEELQRVVQGVSSGTPIQLQMTFYSSPDAGILLVNNLVCYDLVIKHGAETGFSDGVLNKHNLEIYKRKTCPTRM